MSIGTIFLYAGIIDTSSDTNHKVPSGYFLCNGDEYDINTYSQLHTILNSNYLPNLVQYFPVMNTDLSMNVSGGNNTITLNQTPSHNHSLNGIYLSAHSHSYPPISQYCYTNNSDSNASTTNSTPNLGIGGITINLQTLASDAPVTGNLDVKGGSDSIDILNTYICINYIIKAT
jgi:microcystin-dependent protein